MQYTYFLISEVKATRQWHLVSWLHITWGTFLLKNHTQNVVKKLFPDSYLKSQNWAYLWINIVKFKTVCFYFTLIWGLSKYSEIELAADHLLLPNIKLFKKTISSLELISLPHCLHNFWRKIFLLLYSINWPNFIAWLPLIREILSNMCIVIVC